jgi:hypothetical protein
MLLRDFASLNSQTSLFAYRQKSNGYNRILHFVIILPYQVSSERVAIFDSVKTILNVRRTPQEFVRMFKQLLVSHIICSPDFSPSCFRQFLSALLRMLF